jgi:hypothetical protein
MPLTKRFVNRFICQLGFASKVGTSANGAIYKSQGQARSAAERVAPGNKAIDRSEQLQADSLMFQALNEVIDVHTERVAAAEYRLPGIILWLLCATALTALFLTGFASGVRGHRNLYITGALTLLVTAVILVIIALDTTNRGSILIKETRLIELRERLQTEATQTPR